MKPLVSDAIERYALHATKAEPELLQRLDAATQAHMAYPQMLTGRVEGRFLKLIVQLLQPKFILEVGMFTGYSALSMAEGLAADGKLVTCDIDPKAQAMAQAAFDASVHGKKIEIRMGPALETIRQLDRAIDLAFIDADKETYPVYYEEILRRTRSGGVLVLDNMLMSGGVLDPQDTGTRAIAELNDIIVHDTRVENVLLTVRDGVQLVRKK
ncbi:MAG: class I SAM-dependent methyltransferase [Gammaproteobacteria bacterium]|nr:class I SAM-dependent methyltransferase [Gammaproteobacteria bacterium]